MKKSFLLLLFLVSMMGCKSSPTTQVDRKSDTALKGDWTITAVTYPGSNVIKVNSFQLADSQCFVGSNWRFISASNKGNMSINKGGCPFFESPITWFVNKEGNFTLKILDAGEKAKRVREGYVLRLSNLTDNSFQLIDRIDVGGKMTDIVYQFVKN